MPKELPPVRDIVADIQVYSKEPADSHAELLREQYAVMVALHDEWFKQLIRLKAVLETHRLELPEMCDCAFIAREVKTHAESIVKECNTIIDSIAMFGSVKYLTDPNPPKKIEGVYCDGFFDMEKTFIPPTLAKSPEKYTQLMDFLQVPMHLRDIGRINTVEGEFRTEIVKVDWKGFQDYCRGLLEAGYPPPPGLEEGDTFVKPKLTCRRKRDLMPHVKTGTEHQ